MWEELWSFICLKRSWAWKLHVKSILHTYIFTTLGWQKFANPWITTNHNNGLFQKISTHSYRRQRIGYPKIWGFPRRTSAIFAGFQSLLIQNLEEFQNFARIWMVFLEFRLKFAKFWGYLWISSHTHWAFLTRFPMSSMGGGGGVDIFWSSPIENCYS